MTIPAAPELSDTLLQRFCDLVRDCSGLEFSGPRRDDLVWAIERTLAEQRLAAPETLYERLTAGPEAQAALEAFVASLTIPETYFFRNRPQFAALEQHILPELIAQRRDSRRLRIWSAGCATGEEPYSLAILLRRVLPDLAAWDVKILATDINRNLLAKAQRGLYTAWSFRDAPPELQAQYFTPRGAQFELAPEVRRQVAFAYLNLAEDTYPSALTDTCNMDLILFRNVLIYFGEAMTRRVIGRLYEALTDGGWLLVGHAEPSVTLFGRFALRSFPGAVAYQKATPASAPVAFDAAAVVAAPAARSNGPAVAARNGEPRRPRRSLQPAPAMPRMAGRTAGPTHRAQAALAPASSADDLLARYRAIKRLADQVQLESARSSVEALVKQAPLFAPAYYLQGLILQEMGDLEGALAALRRCVYVDAGFVMGHLALANLYAFLGQAERARRHRAQIVRLLAGAPAGDPIPEGDGLTVGDLLKTVNAAAGA